MFQRETNERLQDFSSDLDLFGNRLDNVRNSLGIFDNRLNDFEKNTAERFEELEKVNKAVLDYLKANLPPKDKSDKEDE